MVSFQKVCFLRDLLRQSLTAVGSGGDECGERRIFVFVVVDEVVGFLLLPKRLLKRDGQVLNMLIIFCGYFCIYFAVLTKMA